LADKFLVLGVLAALASIHELSWLPVILIGIREVAMSVFRAYAARRGVSIPARQTAKVKTLLQDIVVGLALMPLVGEHHIALVRGLLWVAVAITLYTGLEYLHDGRRLLAGAAGPAGAA
jgi:CDP-diacylglycerol--glycerol-3-phosphate 3-phosphatidyltransferase